MTDLDEQDLLDLVDGNGVTLLGDRDRTPHHRGHEAAEAAKLLERAIVALEQEPMRVGRVASAMRVEEPLAVALLLERAACESGDTAARTVYLAFLAMVLAVRPRPRLPAGPLEQDHARDWPHEREIAAITGAASRHGLRFVPGLLRELFRLPDPLEGRVPPPHVTIEHLPLGVRRQRARQQSPEQWRPLLVDIDPAVVELLAANPRLGLPEMIRLASNRTTHPWSLWSILLAPRWRKRDGVLLAIAGNPRCPLWLLLAVAPLLPAAELASVLRRRSALHADEVALFAGLHRGANDAWVEERVASLRAREVPEVVEVGLDLEDAGDALAAAFAELVAAVGDDAPGGAAFTATGSLDGGEVEPPGV
ncbi:MAG: hypothetical protein H6747_14840 [Deltaproteobacteria bacterium]|nr:hypothetical protein [Deltaproteobacteria bacterium]